MREFSIVRPEFWTGRTGRELRQHPADVRELACYLFSCPNHEMYGLYYKPLDTMRLETGRAERSIRTSLSVLEQLNFAHYDPINEWVWVVEMAQIQLSLPLKAVDYKVNAVNKWYQNMARNSFLGPYWDRYCDALQLRPPRRDWSPSLVSVTPHTDSEGTDGTAPQGLISISRSVPVHVPLVGEARHAATARFEMFWALYPKRVGKKSAKIEWDKLNPDDLLAVQICDAVERHKRSHRWLRDGGVAIPDPERYLKNERWNDNYDAGPSVSKQTLANVDERPGAFMELLK